MKTLYLVCYDVTDKKRLNKIFQEMNGFGDHVQYSVFICRLTAKEKVLLNHTINKILNIREDKALIVNLGLDNKNSRKRIEQIGINFILKDESSFVI
jgi:CRISPR-associated protein Cas2